VKKRLTKKFRIYKVSEKKREGNIYREVKMIFHIKERKFLKDNNLHIFDIVGKERSYI